jgi:hypothetical protein
MMALDAEPFAIVEREGFRNLMEVVSPQYVLPSRKYFSEKAMPALHSKIKEAVEKALGQAEHISFTTDIWTNTSNTAFISLTGHFIQKDTFSQSVVVLATKPFSDSHTGIRIAELLTEITSQWKIGEKMIHVIVHDNAANMIRASGM